MIETMTLKQQDEARQFRLEEQGTEPPCPFCKRPRVIRSDYVRCNPCGLNWSEGQDRSKDPRPERIRDTKSAATDTGATPAK
jgi:ribosomal protein L37AE/L43A